MPTYLWRKSEHTKSFSDQSASSHPTPLNPRCGGAEDAQANKQASKHANMQASRQASKHAIKRASKPASPPSGKTASQQSSKPASQPARQPASRASICCIFYMCFLSQDARDLAFRRGETRSGVTMVRVFTVKVGATPPAEHNGYSIHRQDPLSVSTV